MKRVIFGYHLEDSKKLIYFWEVNDDVYDWQLEDKNYAIVDTKFGIRLIKIVGYGTLKDDVIEAERKVVKLLEVEENDKSTQDHQ